MESLFSLTIIALCAAPLVAMVSAAAQAQESVAQPSAGQLLQVPVSDLDIKRPKLHIKNPYAGDKNAVAAGKQLFISMNCVGCHAPYGGGGMGPPLSDNRWIYGNKPA
ncbi:MAG TPA: c-type cytochrome, partial [Gammaproteobacteria bacterium]|nr:c-type cytochrome [Gammaproteobacteria bacterium]